MEGRFFNKKNNKHKKIVPCEWRVTLSYIKTDRYIIVTKFINRHNHELFSSFYNSERWRSYVTGNTNIRTITNIQTNIQINNKHSTEEETFMNFDLLQENSEVSFVSFFKKIYHDNLWIVDNIGHPLTLYPLF